MKRRTVKKRMKRYLRHRILHRSNDRHDRWYVLAFMRDCVEILARPGDVNDKVHTVAAVARSLAPSIMSRRAMLQSSEGKP